ncbi:MAG: DUF1573 domain-containing protein [Pseudomonadota bacterium]
MLFMKTDHRPFTRLSLTAFMVLTFMAAGTLHATDASSPTRTGISTPEPDFDFKTVLDGTKVRHDYLVRNAGTREARITHVKTDCSCTTAEYPESIPAGGEGHITLILDTTGYGGQTLSRTVEVSLDDPDTPFVALKLEGAVDTFATISPANVSLTGPPGTGTRTEVTIVPSPKYPFSIVGTSVKSKKNIACSLARSADRYVLTVQNLLEQPGRYFEIIVLTTDSPLQPELKIRVMGIIRNS